MKEISFRLSAGGLYERGQVEGLACDGGKAAMVLDDTALIEDDGDGCGYPFEKDILSGATRIRKELTLDLAPVAAARLLLFHTVQELWKSPAYEAAARIDVNGHPYRAALTVGWNTIVIDPAHLVRGRNVIALWTPEGGAPAIIPIALRPSILDNAPWRAAAPQASHKSDDGGTTWSARLGEANAAEGEYMIRLRVRRYASMGTYVSPVLDAADVKGEEVVKLPAVVGSLAVDVEQEAPAGTAVNALIRTGQTPVFDAGAWEPWRPLGGGDRSAKGRYFQVKVVLTSSDPLRTPALRGLTVRAEVEHPAAPPAPRVEEFRSYPVIRGSLPFEYEPLDHPLLRELRDTYRLEEVVRGGATQFDRIVRLNHWVSQQWNWHPPVVYPEWNALDILRRQADGQCLGGFCGHYAIVMVQCCLAMGIQARFVFGSLPGVIAGHEVVEVWSDEYGKWALMDPNMDRHYLDRATNIPMNMMDLHRAVLDHFFAGGGLGSPEYNKERVGDAAFEEFVRRGPVACFGGNAAGPDWFDGRRAHLMWGHPALMPRSSFLSRRRPMPKCHGYGLPWCWNGYWHWFDPRTPRQDTFVRHTDRQCDFYWNLNQVGFFLEQTEGAGVLRVTTETNTPGLEALLVSIDGGEWTASAPAFFWRLRKGANSLRLKVRNLRGVEGRESVASLVWDG